MADQWESAGLLDIGSWLEGDYTREALLMAPSKVYATSLGYVPPDLPPSEVGYTTEKSLTGQMWTAMTAAGWPFNPFQMIGTGEGGEPVVDLDPLDWWKRQVGSSRDIVGQTGLSFEWPDINFPDLGDVEKYGYMALVGLGLVAVIMFLK
jgi:hypothetical protein